MKIVEYVDFNLVWFLRKADKVMILSTATNSLTMLFKTVVVAAEKYLLSKDFFIHSKTIIWIRGKTWIECKTLLLPYYGNLKARANRRNFDLQTCINNPLCLNLEQFACYHEDAEFLISLLKTDAFAQSEYLYKIDCLRFEKIELISSSKKILTTEPTIINHPFLKSKWGSVAETLLQQIHDPELNDPLKNNVALTANLMQQVWDIPINLNNRDNDFLKLVFQQIEKNVEGDVRLCSQYFGKYIESRPERIDLLSDKIKWLLVFDLCDKDRPCCTIAQRITK